MESEVIYAFLAPKNRKPPGEDICAEVFKLVN
jgi:hypothetical protein